NSHRDQGLKNHDWYEIFLTKEEQFPNN
ncbi:hypothetical protein HKBW3S06_01500, partial [Candidatus Hakubella thermalkaliphila]